MKKTNSFKFIFVIIACFLAWYSFAQPPCNNNDAPCDNDVTKCNKVCDGIKKDAYCDMTAKHCVCGDNCNAHDNNNNNGNGGVACNTNSASYLTN